MQVVVVVEVVAQITRGNRPSSAAVAAAVAVPGSLFSERHTRSLLASHFQSLSVPGGLAAQPLPQVEVLTVAQEEQHLSLGYLPLPAGAVDMPAALFFLIPWEMAEVVDMEVKVTPLAGLVAMGTMPVMAGRVPAQHLAAAEAVQGLSNQTR
ncbi:TPA: hypothetical protein I9Y43_004039 [Kluyvera ascorbata]|nr:hypothetical protein [Kluyvera ascorbata]